jgi:GntR family transcriptional regulator / MocR family aminotransferase
MSHTEQNERVDLVIDLTGTGEKTVLIYRALRAAVVDGRLPAGHRLPPSRALAADLGVARGSVAAAYERLAAEGFLTTRVGSGTFVAALKHQRTRRPLPADPLRPRAGWTFDPVPVSGDETPPRYDFRTGIPDATLFPFDTWRRLVSAELRLRANDPGTYAAPAGHPALRAAIARSLGYGRSVRATADDVLVTNGTQHALDLIARVLLRPGDVVAVEEPGYPPARRLFASVGARVASVPVDEDGLVVSALPGNARLVYTTPSHQFPLGGAMSLDRRRELLDWARTRPAAIVEDDYDSEFRFSSRPLEPLYSLDTAGRVLYVGTFSKSMLPMVRTGFVIAPAGLRPALAAARQMGDGYGQIPVQAALARFIDEGQLARHVRRAAKVYAERYARVVAALDGVLPSSAGLHVTALLSEGGPARAAEVTARARERGVAFDDLSQYVHDSDTQAAGFVFGLGAIGTDEIAPGLAIVTDLLLSNR